MRVRNAEAGDWPAVAALLAELGRPDVRGSGGEAEHESRFRSYLTRPDATALVAEWNGEVVGFVDLEFRQRLNFAAPQAWIPDLVVAAHARRRGAGAALICRAAELAQERGCWGMTLESANWRADAHRFYVSEGWLDSGKSFTKPLGDMVWPPPQPRLEG